MIPRENLLEIVTGIAVNQERTDAARRGALPRRQRRLQGVTGKEDGPLPVTVLERCERQAIEGMGVIGCIQECDSIARACLFALLRVGHEIAKEDEAVRSFATGLHVHNLPRQGGNARALRTLHAMTVTAPRARRLISAAALQAREGTSCEQYLTQYDSYIMIFHMHYLPRRSSMSTLIAWEPLRELSSMSREMDRFFERMHATRARTWRPAADIDDTADAYMISLDIPGCAEDEIEIEAHDHTLAVRGVRDMTAPESEGQTRMLTERPAGRFERIFHLPDNVDIEGIRAHHAQGVLAITVPKLTTAHPRRIPIEKAGS